MNKKLKNLKLLSLRLDSLNKDIFSYHNILYPEKSNGYYSTQPFNLEKVYYFIGDFKDSNPPRQKKDLKKENFILYSKGVETIYFE